MKDFKNIIHLFKFSTPTKLIPLKNPYNVRVFGFLAKRE